MEEARSFIEDFGQKVDLTQRIREVLVNYPEGTTILKELIQNADDAGASSIRFCIDRRPHGSDSLLSESLSQFQGPGLLAFNNAEFSDSDFESISRIGDSKKQDQSWKTGRFGIGFNSVYHLSDLPSFVSGNHLVLFDPQCKYLPSVSSLNPGKRIDFVRSLALKNFRDQCSPYQVFGCDMINPFKGTLFRFPLRSANQASTSRLSKQSFTPEDISQLLENLSLELVEIMIFLKNVESVEIYEWNPGAPEPEMLHSCYVKSGSEIRRQRQSFLRLAKGMNFNEETPRHTESYRLELVRKGGGVEESISSFLVSQMMAPSSSKISSLARNAFRDHGMRLLPWVAIAASLSENQELQGRAFCFLPLPLKTGLPVHINGFFELSANRRDIWYGSDMDRIGKLRSEWNQSLLEEVAAPCLAILLYEARKLGAGSSYYSMWPVGSFGEPWIKLVQKFYRGVTSVPLLYTPGKKTWLSPKEAFLHDEDYEKSEVLAEALLGSGLPVTRLPEGIREMLLKFSGGSLKIVTPGGVRTHLQQKGCGFPEKKLIFAVLDYCLSDLLDEDVADQLRGLALVPLENQSVGCFGLRSDERKFYLCGEAEHGLLRGVASKLVDREVPEFLAGRLRSIAGLGLSNLCLVDDETLGELLRYVLPLEWENSDEVQWRPGVESRHPERDWLSGFWEYLCSERRSLSKLKKWPLFPTTTGTLRRPLGLSGLLRGGKMNRELEGALVKAGCSFLDMEFKHPELSEYVRDPCSAELLDALGFGSNISKLGAKFASVSSSEKREIRSHLYKVCWASRSEMNEHRLQIFKSLPIFEAFNNLGAESLIFVSLHGTLFLAPGEVDINLLGPDCLSSTGPEETQVLTRLLGVPELKKSEFFKRSVLHRLAQIPAHSRDVSMLQILRELPQLSIEDRFFVESLKQLSFVPTRAGELKPPSSLYDPENLELLELLHDEQLFPSAQYSAPDVLQSLRSLGLRSSVTPETILTSARSVEALLASDPVKATELGRVLLSYLDKNSARWLPSSSSQETGINWLLSRASTLLQSEREASLNAFWNELSGICWCPVLMEPLHPQMPWPEVSQPLAPPRLIRLSSDIWLVSATMRILDGSCDSPGVCQRFGWLSRPGGNILAAQLLELGKRETHELGKVLATTIPRIYSLLSDLAGSDEMEVVKVILEDCSWIWVGSRFAKARDVVFEGPQNLAPYLHVVPADLAAFRELFVELGVKETLGRDGYVSILSVLAKEKQGSPLDSRQLAAVVWIVQHLADLNHGDQPGEIMVPDADGVLVSSSHLVYNDAPWLFAASRDLQPGWLRDSGKRLVYSKLSNDVAERVGISSVRRSLLAESADFMDLGLHHDGMEAFGQSESLTNRLKHIVEMYVDGPGILFELLQNADDAGASEVCFLLDEASFGTSSVLSRQMADWQGPALYCYNNSVFKPEDLRAISRIGQNSKLDKPSAIGRFGLGFNSVYHFTDVPGFVSGSNVVLLDPHAANLPGITPAQPGLKINFVGKDLVKQFPDQFEPFLFFGCDLLRPFDGTLFRFPLRTMKAAARSEIKQEPYDLGDVWNLFSALRSTPEVLLFLRSLRSVKVFTRKEMNGELVEVFKLERENGDYQEKELQEFVRGAGDHRSDKEQFVRRLEKTGDKLLPSSSGLIRLAITSPDDEKLTTSWLISSGLGGGNAKQFALVNRSRGFVPWAGVAAKVTPGESFEGRAFCFLPLPVKAGLPVHVNGYFELSANRRDIWYDGDMVGKDKLRSEWNINLLRDAAAPAYARLLHRAALELGPGDRYHSLWPTECAGEPWRFLMLEVYRSVTELELPVLYTGARGGKWVSPKQGVFPDVSFPEMKELGDALVKAGLPLVEVPGEVVEKFREVYPSLRFFSPHLLRRLLITSRRSFERSISVLALKYCMLDVEKPDEEGKLHGLSLVPMSDNSYGTLNSRDAGAKIILADEVERELLRDSFSEMLADIQAGDEVFLKLKGISHNGVTNVFVMSPGILQELLPVVLPPEWSGKEAVSWTPGQNGHPSLLWMEQLWSYLGNHLDELSPKFSTWPLLPTSDDRLLRLSRGGPVIVNDGWSENMISVLQKSGCFLLRAGVPIKLREFAHEASAHGVLLAMFSAAGGNLKLIPGLLSSCEASEVRELRQFLFQTRWFSSGPIDEVQLQVLRNLQLFESSGNKFRCLNECKQLIAPGGIDEELIGEALVRAEPGKEEDILQAHFGLRKLNKEEFLRDHFVECIAEIPELERMGVFQRALKDFSHLREGALPSLSRLPFVPTSSGFVEAPERLYDPRVSELQTLLDRKFFPAEEFHNRELLEVLVSLGLRRSLGQEGLLDSARSVSLVETSEAAQKAKALLSHIEGVLQEEASANSLEDEFWRELSDISWCPVLQAPPNPLLPWLTEQETPVSPPKLVRPREDSWLVSGSMRILDSECSDLLAEKLGWRKTPKASVLAHQLVLLCNKHRETQKDLKNQDLLEENSSLISQQVKNIYKLLHGFLDCQEMLILQAMLEGQPWLWIGDGFVSGREVAMDSPANFHPYLHVLPLELLEFRELFTRLGVREAFHAEDYIQALLRLAGDLKNEKLKPEQLTFVLSLLNTLSEVLDAADARKRNLILVPDADCFLVAAKALVFNDAPWLTQDSSSSSIYRLVHPEVDNELARKLGARSLRYLSVVDQEMTSSLPCLGMEKIVETLSSSGSGDHLLFDLLQVADFCRARRVHFVFDDQEHSKQSLLQPNLSEFQGPALLMILEGVSLSTEDICSLHSNPPVKFRGQTSRYGAGLFAAYRVTDLTLVVSSGCLFLFDPSGRVLASALADGVKDPTGNPIGKAFSLRGTGLVERFNDQFQPFNVDKKLSLDSPNITFFRFPLRGLDQSSTLQSLEIPQLFSKFRKHSTNSLLFLKFLKEVVVAERTSEEPLREMFSASINSASTTLRHPFEEKNWRKFQLSNFFGTSNAATKTHTIDVFFRENGSTMATKWIVVQTLASGQTRDMALDRRYLHYQLTPIAGVAACISGDSSEFTQSSFMSPLPVGDELKLPVTIYGNFLPFTSGARQLFIEALGDYPVKVGMLGSHSGPVLSDDIIRATWNRQLLHCVSDSYIELLQAIQHSHLGDSSVSYSFWPRSSSGGEPSDDARCLIKWLIKPMYPRLVEMPLWQLHSGAMVKFSEGVFIAPFTGGAAPKASVSEFLKAHYRIFTAPWELGKEAEEATGSKAMELTPGTLRSLIKAPSVAAAIQSVETQIDLLEYCCVDALPEESSSSSSTSGEELQLSKNTLLELKGVTCPTANEFMVKLGTIEVWVASKEQQDLLPALLKRFLHPSCLERPLLAKLFGNKQFQLQLNLKPFSSRILAENLRSALPRDWAQASAPWFEWDRKHPSEEWIRSLWENIDPSSSQELELFDVYPLIPATRDQSALLVRVSHREEVFVPRAGDFAELDESYPWLLPVLSKLGVPVFHRSFRDIGAYECCKADEEIEMVEKLLSNLVALRRSGLLRLSGASSLSDDECTELFGFLATLATGNEALDDAEVEVLMELPIHKTVRGRFVPVDPALHFTLPPEPLLLPDDNHCLAHVSSSQGEGLYSTLGIPELDNDELLVRCILPKYSSLSSDEQSKVVAHIYQEWGSLSSDVISSLKSTKFVMNGGNPPEPCAPSELIDPENPLLKQVFAEERWRFPGMVFSTPRWLRMLRQAGLRSIQDPALILECARKVEELGRQDLSFNNVNLLGNSSVSSRHVSDTVWSLAGLLVEEVLNNLALLYSNSFCDSLSKVEFVPAESGFPVVSGGDGACRILTSYSKAALLKDWALSWTCCPLLTRSTLVPPEFSWGALHLRSPPPFSAVIKHLQVVGSNSGEDVLSRWPNSKGSRSVEEVFGEILSYLETTWNELSDSDKKQLSSLAFIPVANGTRLVTASSLYTKLGMDLAPFVFEVPRAYLSHVKILSGLGTRHEPLASDMVSLLVELQQSCGYQPLNPNELQAVFSVLRFICSIISRGDFTPEDIVVPDENSRLVHATSCAYVDAAGAHLVDKIDPSKTRFVHPSLPEETCIVTGVKKLSEIVLEELDESEPLHFLDSLGEYSLSFVQLRLASSEFGELIWSIIPDLKKKEEVLEILQRASQELRFVKTIRTNFLLVPGMKNITRQGEHRALFYVNRSKSCLLAAEPPGFLSVPDLLALLVSQFLESSSLCLPLAPLFNRLINGDSSSLKHAAKLLAPGIDHTSRKQGAGADKLLGKPVLPVDSKALQFCPLRPFYSGEIVGWQENGGESQARYGRVVEDIRAPAGQPLYRIHVETSPGEVQLLASSSVFSFKGTGNSSSARGNLVKPLVENQAVASSSSSSPSDVASSGSDQAPEEGASVLNASGYTQAISDILASLGLPLSLERQSLLEHTLSLQEQLSSANTLLAAEQARADAAASQVEAVKSSWTCRICLGSEVETMLVPCGHVLCQSCSPSLSKCPFCRRFITSRHTIYRP